MEALHSCSIFAHQCVEFSATEIGKLVKPWPPSRDFGASSNSIPRAQACHVQERTGQYKNVYRKRRRHFKNVHNGLGASLAESNVSSQLEGVSLKATHRKLQSRQRHMNPLLRTFDCHNRRLATRYSEDVFWNSIPRQTRICLSLRFSNVLFVRRKQVSTKTCSNKCRSMTSVPDHKGHLFSQWRQKQKGTKFFLLWFAITCACKRP